MGCSSHRVVVVGGSRITNPSHLPIEQSGFSNLYCTSFVLQQRVQIPQVPHASYHPKYLLQD